MNSRIIEVRYGNAARVVNLVGGGVLIAVGSVGFAAQWWDLHFLFGGVAAIVASLWLARKPYCSYDVRAKTVFVYWGGTRRVRWTFGAQNGERLYVDNGRIRRIGLDGKAKFVHLGWGCERADRERLIRVIESQDRQRRMKDSKRH
ncbi:hypothetical protein [Glycomyces xiaoerkulensis]|uniref:hypothetical protein n=1 Tax=Glycomyces xiaoerkulensis TaxID=2038139 RepID=UPI00130014CD|nr:hypothetical protein [Glycomyces xiaoerkulensis]